LTAHKPAIAYDCLYPCRPMACSHMQGSPVPTSCPNTVYTALAHTLQGSVLPNYAAPPTPLVQLCPSDGLHQRARTIENA
jgi:hypothetical protein